MNTVLNTFFENVAKFHDSTCFLIKDKEGQEWKALTWSDVIKRVTDLALSLKRNGISKGDAVAIFCSTRVEWTVIDLAIMSIGAVSVPIYHTLARDTIEYILNHSQSKLVFVEDLKLLEKISGMKSELPILRDIILIEGVDESGDVTSLGDFIEITTSDPQKEFQTLLGDLSKDDIATCVYTSGTTGEPKGVELTHANILGEVEGLCQIFHFSENDIGLLFLPLAHVVARAMQFYQLCQGCVTAYAESIEKLPENIMEVRPHFMVVVPRVMEKIYEKVRTEVARGPSFRKYIFNKSIEVAKDASRRIRRHRALSFLVAIKYWMVRKVVFSKLHKKLGGRIKMVISGGAPLSKDIAEFFHAVGCLVIEGYGLTETMAAISINRPDDFKFGTVGKALYGVELRLAEDGEILVKGPQVFKGYKEPISPADECAIEDGWFKTGDIGEFSRDGFLRITGRKKELIVTSSGKNIVPQRVEEIIKSSPYIREIIVFGDRRKYLSALVIPDPDNIAEFARQKGQKFGSISDLLNNSGTYQLIKSEIECKNRELARHETIKKFAIIESELTQEKGELTPTLKVKRKKIYDIYKDVIEGMYEREVKG